MEQKKIERKAFLWEFILNFFRFLFAVVAEEKEKLLFFKLYKIFSSINVYLHCQLMVTDTIFYCSFPL